ncbi:hypothetical protein COCCADRAFT_33002 [Bipolaris zeicola 26-R-13]|uniref:Uncharacterized protein n=1 Tax=Cochliobolus carbonum (strain 26-R-13) TaxID=930089 RepID=W6YJS4_COCC2|nr:uncharacterized protein COCCADRAFT_33002 [Bipolaris zeicola 26-R-13]EUC37908.1 hypothetical protein COCCADRAFT_33002 [Bipolaris zeicola 26-R-13]
MARIAQQKRKAGHVGERERGGVERGEGVVALGPRADRDQETKGPHGTRCDMQPPPHLPPASTAGQDVIEPRLTDEAEMPAQSCRAISVLAVAPLPGHVRLVHGRPANRVRASKPTPFPAQDVPASPVEAMALQAKLHDSTLVPTVGSCASRPSHCGT